MNRIMKKIISLKKERIKLSSCNIFGCCKNIFSFSKNLCCLKSKYFLLQNERPAEDNSDIELTSDSEGASETIGIYAID